MPETGSSHRVSSLVPARLTATVLLAVVLLALVNAGAANAAVSAGGVFAFGENNEGQLGITTNSGSTTPNPTPAPLALPGENGPVTRLAAGAGHDLLVTSSGQLFALGDNFYGELGNTTSYGTSAPNPTPSLVVLPGQSGSVTRVATGTDDSLVVTSSGQLYAFGYNFSGQLGNATDNGTNTGISTPGLVTLPGESGPVTDVAAASFNSFAATSTGQLYAFGFNQYGQLGNTTNNGVNAADPTPTLVTLPGQSGTIAQIAAGYIHTLVLTSSGQLYGFGDNYFGELGNTTNNGVGNAANPTPTPVTLPGQSGTITQIAAGNDDSFALTSSGQLYAFGYNNFGELGIATNSGTGFANPTPTRVSLPGQSGAITQIAAGVSNTLVVTSSGQLYSFGSNQYGQLGNTTNSGSSTAANPTPTLVTLPAGTTIDTVARGPAANHVLALVSDLAITSSLLPTGQAGASYSSQLDATGGTAPLTWSATGLPSGLAVNPASGVIAGTTSSSGTFSVAVTVLDTDGSQATRTLMLTIVPIAKLAPPGISGASQSHTSWREGNGLARITAAHKPPIGTTFKFTLNEQATVSFAFTQQAKGRKIKGKCVAPTKKNKRKPSCKLTVAAGTLTFTGHAGINTVAFQGRVTASKKLRPGRYTLVITAKNQFGHTPAAKKLTFTILR